MNKAAGILKGERNTVDAHVEKDAVNWPSQADQDEIVRQRKDKLERLIAEEGYNPYLVEKWDRKHSLAYVRENFSHLAGH